MMKPALFGSKEKGMADANGEWRRDGDSVSRAECGKLGGGRVAHGHSGDDVGDVVPRDVAYLARRVCHELGQSVTGAPSEGKHAAECHADDTGGVVSSRA